MPCAVQRLIMKEQIYGSSLRGLRTELLTMGSLVQMAYSKVRTSVLLRDDKAAVIDLDRVLQEYYKTKIVEGNLKRQADIYKDYAKKLGESLTKLQSEFVALRDSSQNIALSDNRIIMDFLLKRDEAGARHAMSIHMKHLINTLQE